MSNDRSPNETVFPPTTPRRWHRSTYVVAAFVSLLGVMFNLGGDYRGWEYRITHGWPWVYGQREVSTDQISRTNMLPLFWFRVDTCSFELKWLCLNMLVVLGITAVIAWFWEIRRRRLKHWLQFTLLDWFVGTLSVTSLYWLCTPYTDSYNEKAFVAICEKHRVSVNVSVSDEENSDPCGDYLNYVPYTWLWETFGVPLRYRPHQLRSLPLRFWMVPEGQKTKYGNEMMYPDYLPDEIALSISRFKHVVKLKLNTSQTVGFTRTGWNHIRTLPKLRHMELNSSFLRDEQIDGSPWFPTLETLELQNTNLTAVGLMKITQGSRLKSLAIPGKSDETVKLLQDANPQMLIYNTKRP